jgi:hypothetical protein
MTTRIVFESGLWLFECDAVPERGTNVMLVGRFAHPTHKATLATRATKPDFRFNPIE